MGYHLSVSLAAHALHLNDPRVDGPLSVDGKVKAIGDELDVFQGGSVGDAAVDGRMDVFHVIFKITACRSWIFSAG